MKRIRHLSLAIAIIMLVFACMPVAMAASLYASEPLSLREGPGTKYKIITELRTGDKVEVVDNYGKWTKVVFEGMTGYVYDQYLTAEKIIIKGQAAATAKINLRSGPGTQYKKLGSIKKGTSIDVLSLDGDWASFFYAGKLVYAHSDYIAYDEVRSSMPDYATQEYLNDLGLNILDKYGALPKRLKSQFNVCAAYYDMNADKFYVDIVDLDATKEKLFKKHISDWEYITLKSIDQAPGPRV